MVKTRILISPQTKPFNSSNLLGKELILRLPKIDLSGFLILRAFKGECCEVLLPEKSKLESRDSFTGKHVSLLFSCQIKLSKGIYIYESKVSSNFWYNPSVNHLALGKLCQCFHYQQK